MTSSNVLAFAEYILEEIKKGSTDPAVQFTVLQIVQQVLTLETQKRLEGNA